MDKQFRESGSAAEDKGTPLRIEGAEALRILLARQKLATASAALEAARAELENRMLGAAMPLLEGRVLNPHFEMNEPQGVVTLYAVEKPALSAPGTTTPSDPATPAP